MQTENTALQQRFYLLPLTAGEQDGEPLYCLFTQNQVAEVLGPRTIHPVPFSPEYVRGFILRHDNLVPVIDVDALCGGTGKKDKAQSRQLLVMRTGQTDAASGDFLKLALLCPSAVLTFKLSERDAAQAVAAEDMPAQFTGQSLARGSFRLRGYRVVLLDFDSLAQGTHGSTEAGSGQDEPFVW